MIGRLVVACLLMVACQPLVAIGFPCRTRDDCAASAVCLQGACVVPCNSDIDCGAGSCAAGFCSNLEPSEGEGEIAPNEGEGEEGEGEEGEGEGEGEEGEGEGEGEGEQGEGEGEGEEGEGEQGEGEGELPSVCAAQDPFLADLNGDCRPDLVIGQPGGDDVFFQQGIPDGVVTGSAALDFVNGIFGSASLGSRFGAAFAASPVIDGQQRSLLVAIPNEHQVRILRFAGSPWAELSGGDEHIVFDVSVTPIAVATSLVGGQLRALVGSGNDVRLVVVANGPATILRTVTVGLVRSIIPSPDLDGDGAADFWVGCDAVVAVSSATGLVIVGVGPNVAEVSAGSALSSVADHDGDGIAELAIGIPARGRAGGAALFTSSGVLTRFEAPPAFVSNGGRFGASIAAILDLDSDGRQDLLIGAPEAALVGPDNPLCDVDSGAGYVGDCSGRVLVVKSSAIDVVEPCLDGVPGFRLGAAIRSLGPHPEALPPAQRVLVGAPGVDVSTGAAAVANLAPLVGGCGGTVDVMTDANTAVAGDRTGAALGP